MIDWSEKLKKLRIIVKLTAQDLDILNENIKLNALQIILIN